MTSKWIFVLSATHCPINFLQLHNKCYYFSSDVEQWSNAHYRCSSLNSTLVTLRSKHNEKRLIEYLRKENIGKKEWWIGARFDWQQRRWKWGNDGKPLKFNRFVHQLQQKSKLEWHCAFLDQRHHYQWNADPCTRKKHYICMQNDLFYQGSSRNDKDNAIPVIISRDLLEEEHLNSTNGDNQPAFIVAPSTPSSLKPKEKVRPGTAQQRYVCPKGYGTVRNACYKFSKAPAAWQEAYFNCTAEFNGTLAIIPDKKYDRGIRRYAKRIKANAHERWIGGIYDWEKTAWKWAANGVIIQHQERDRKLLEWHCLTWSPLLTDKWTSDLCLARKHYICQSSPQMYVPMDMRRRQRPHNQVNVKEDDYPRIDDKGKFDYSLFIEIRNNATRRRQPFQYKQYQKYDKTPNDTRVNVPYRRRNDRPTNEQ